MRKIFGFLSFMALAFVLSLSALDAAPGPNNRGSGDVSRTGMPGSVVRPPSIGMNMPGFSPNTGGANWSVKVPTTGPASCADRCCNGCCGCHCNCGTEPTTGCTPGATQACKTSDGQDGTQVCKDDKTWDACVAIPKHYTVDDCMNALLACINGGGLPGGINDLFDANIRNGIISGMNLCKAVVDKCIANIPIYHSAADVWLDFNSRVIQPQYYSFVLRKTGGLTPNQAENTCWLVDTNMYGKSFGAVNDADQIHGEYKEQIGAYNMNTDTNARPDQNAISGKQDSDGKNDKDNPIVIKTNPQGLSGPPAGNPAYDSKRGHYARWDASLGECLVRVAAYNKDELITNRWLGIGDDKAAEVWRATGTTFSCNKELFEFGLMNQTKSAALLGTTIGTGVGAGVGALIGHGMDNKNKSGLGDFCGTEAKPNKANLESLDRMLSDNTKRAILNEYLGGPAAAGSKGNASSKTDGSTPSANPFYQQITLKPNQPIAWKECNEIVTLYGMYQQWKIIDTRCSIGGRSTLSFYLYCDGAELSQRCQAFMNEINTEYQNMYTKGGDKDFFCQLLNDTFDIAEKKKAAAYSKADITEDDETLTQKAGVSNDLFNDALAAKAVVERFTIFIDVQKCKGKSNWANQSRADECPMFKNPNLMFKSFNKDVFCKDNDRECIDGATFEYQVQRLGSVLETLNIGGSFEEKTGMSNAAKGALIGGATGLVAGGLATAITAFVEKNNISCRVGDGLDKVQLNKSGTIGSLKDFYVKWKLNLPDIIGPAPTTPVTDCAGWTAVCESIMNISDCISAAIHYKPASANTATMVHNACAIDGGKCKENRPVAVSQGACQ